MKTKEVTVFVLKNKECMTLKICNSLKFVHRTKTSEVSFSFDNNLYCKYHAFLLSSGVSHLPYMKFTWPLHPCQPSRKISKVWYKLKPSIVQCAEPRPWLMTAFLFLS